MFCVACRDSAPALQVEKSVFYEVTKLIEVAVVVTLLFSIFPGRNHDVHSQRQRFFDDLAAVVASIRQQILGRNSVDQGASLLAISNGTCCDKKSDRHTMRIHGQMYFGVEPPFVRAMSWFPPGAPLA